MTATRSYIEAEGRLPPNLKIAGEIERLASICENIQQDPDGRWRFDLPVSLDGAYEVAQGDLEDLLAEEFPLLCNLKSIYGASYRLYIAVGVPHPTRFELKVNVVAMCAALGMSICVTTQGQPD